MHEKNIISFDMHTERTQCQIMKIQQHDIPYKPYQEVTGNLFLILTIL